MASTDLLISQYRGTSVEKILEAQLASRDALLDEPLRELGRMADVRTAAGVWLDAIGAKLGVHRPHEGSAPMTDERFRRCVLARGAILGGGTFGDGLAKLDPWATWAENVDEHLVDGEPLSIRVWTQDPGLARLADVMGCVWRPAGVGATYYDYSLTPGEGFWETATTAKTLAVQSYEIAPPALLDFDTGTAGLIRTFHINSMSLSNANTLQITLRTFQARAIQQETRWAVSRFRDGWLLNVDAAVGLPAFSLDFGELAETLSPSISPDGRRIFNTQLNIPLTAQQYGELHSHTPRVFRFRRKE